MTEITSIKKRAILFDASRCIDCRACMVACSVENNVPNDVTRIWLAGEGVFGEYPDLERATMPYHCMHCEKPDCVSACPVGAYTKRSDGPVIYDSSKCIGCRYCMNACPFDVPHFEWDRGLNKQPIIIKCDLCNARVEGNQEPACVATCPTGALMFGDRDELLEYAHAKIEAHPDRYVDHVFGETENGGTSYLIISHAPFDKLGLPTNIGNVPVNVLSEKIMSYTLPFAAGWTAMLSGVAMGVRVVKKRTAAPEEIEATEKQACE